MIDNPNVDKITHNLRGVARVWSILVWILALVLILGTLFRPPSSEQAYAPIDNLILALLIVSMVGLVVAWRWEGWGALINIGAYLAIVPVYGLIHQKWIHPSVLVAFSPIILPGVFYAAAWERGRNVGDQDTSSVKD